MRRYLQSGFLAVFWLALSVTGSVGEEPVYIQRLALPVLQDDIGYGHAVISDPHTGEIFVCDPRKNRILIFDPEGVFKHQILGGDEMSAIEDLAVDPEGRLVVLVSRSDRRVAVELDFDGVFRRELPLRGVEPGLPVPRLVSVAMSGDGQRVYLLDTANIRVWLTDRKGNVERWIDLAAALEEEDRRNIFLGQVDVYGDNVLVAVPSHGEILRFDLSGRLLAFIGRKGTSRCELGRATAAALTRSGDFWIIDQQRMLLTRWSGSDGRCMGEYIGLGDAPGYLYYPYDLTLDGRGRLYIAQSFDGRVQVYEGSAPAAGWPVEAETPGDKATP